LLRRAWFLRTRAQDDLEETAAPTIEAMWGTLDELPNSVITDFLAKGREILPVAERKHAPEHEILVSFEIERSWVHVPKQPTGVAHDDLGQLSHKLKSTT
jgi:hypothetical protein